ncbi:MAG: hypothetical protein V1820_02540 [archaeon]
MASLQKAPSSFADDIVFGLVTLVAIVSIFSYSMDFDRAFFGKVAEVLALGILLFAAIRLQLLDAKLGMPFGKTLLLCFSGFLVLVGFGVFAFEEIYRPLKFSTVSPADLFIGAGFVLFVVFLLKTFLPLFAAYSLRDQKQVIALGLYLLILSLTASFLYSKRFLFENAGFVAVFYVALTVLTLILTTGLAIYIDEGLLYMPIVLTSIAFFLISAATLQYCAKIISSGFRTGGAEDFLWIFGFLLLAVAKTIELEMLKGIDAAGR